MFSVVGMSCMMMNNKLRKEIGGFYAFCFAFGVALGCFVAAPLVLLL